MAALVLVLFGLVLLGWGISDARYKRNWKVNRQSDSDESSSPFPDITAGEQQRHKARASLGDGSAGFLLAFCAGLVIMARGDDPSQTVKWFDVLIAMAIGAPAFLFVVHRFRRVSLTSSGDEMEIVNPWRHYRVSASDVPYATVRRVGATRCVTVNDGIGRRSITIVALPDGCVRLPEK